MFAPILLAAMFGPYSLQQEYELLATVTVAGRCTRDCAGGNTSFGAGEIVGERDDGTLLVLTARHVVADMAEPRVFLRNDVPPGTPLENLERRDNGRRATVELRATGLDLALLTFHPLSGDAFAVIPFSTRAQPQHGDIVGAPYGYTWTLSAFRYVQEDPTSFWVSCNDCGPGDSGGGVFDEDGKLSGVVVSRVRSLNREHQVISTEFGVVPMRTIDSFLAARLPAPHARVAALPAPQAPQVSSSAPSAAWARFAALRHVTLP